MASVDVVPNGVDVSDVEYNPDLVPVPALEEANLASGADESLLSDADATVEPSGDEQDKTAGFVATAAPDGSAVADLAPEPAVKTHEFYYIKIPRPDLTAEIGEIKACEQKFREKREKQQFISAALRIKRVRITRLEADIVLWKIHFANTLSGKVHTAHIGS